MNTNTDNISKQEGEYREPIGFKGTPGEFYIGGQHTIRAHEAGKESWEDSVICIYSGGDINNAALLSQAKEMAKALHDLIADVKDWEEYNRLQIESFDGNEANLQRMVADEIKERLETAKAVLSKAIPNT